MADQWHYSKGGEKLGPVSQEELEGLLSSGDLQGSDLVWKDGMDNWAAADIVQELASAVSSAPLPAPPASQGSPPPMPTTQSNDDFFRKLGVEGILVGAGAGVTLIACLLPWISAFYFTSLGVQVWGGLICFLCAIAAGVCFGIYHFKPGMKENKQNAMIFSIVFTATGGLCVLLSFVFIVSVVAGVGSIFALLGGGALTAGGVMSLLAVNKISG